MRPYFWSATKSYGVPRLPPRPRGDPTVRRLTEVGVACAFDRLGDNGTVAGQTIVGIPRVLELVDSPPEGARLRVWPFDGLHLGGFTGSHVMVEPYPSKVRADGIAQTDANDAIACVTWAQTRDRSGALASELDLRGLSKPRRGRVRFEGWIAGVSPADPDRS